ncbi:MAG: DUF262 domain-containing protein [Patescibacteria group bacterium]|nr:DUF262 domain-containing protein [Patescibacteria group bacterium]
MKIELHQIKVRDLVEGYINNDEEGVVGYHGKLDIRPPYQREFVYKPDQQVAVINTVLGKFPLNAIYWVKNSDGTFEILDGQQRTVSICNFIERDFSIVHDGHTRYFGNLSDEDQEKIMNYELMVYFCEGTEGEKTKWFEVINTAGEKLTHQELLNAVYRGPWIMDAKRYFSRSTAPVGHYARDYLSGSQNRQEYLETVLRWVSGDKIEGYMGKHQEDLSAKPLWEYFQKVIEWVRKTFPEYRREMKSVEWGELYNKFKDKKLNAKKLEAEIQELMQDEDVTKKSGIYPYVLTRDERFLNIRAFTDRQKREAYERQKGVCIKCKKRFDIEEMEADHIKPWHEGGKTVSENCQMLCKQDNRTKSGR